MKRRVVIVLALALAACLGCGKSPVAAPQGGGERDSMRDADITGVYTPEYQPKSTVQITKEGEVYTVRWDHPWGAWLGVGLREGDKLSVGWHRVDGQDLGVSIYKIEPGGQGPKLVSRFAGYRDNKIQEETLRFLRREGK
jgi:hypothetical protein